MNGKKTSALRRLLLGLGLIAVFQDHARCMEPILDEEAVFCIYFRMSGETLDDRDVEDLCHAQGRPTFSLYKPSEMVIQNTLKKTKKRLLEKMGGYNGDTLFRWTLACPSHSRDFIAACQGGGFEFSGGMPSPTSFILSELSEYGRRSIRGFVRSLQIDGRLDLKGAPDYDLILLLRPLRVEHRNQTRIIARKTVQLPIRAVVFRPVRAGLSFRGSHGKMLFTREFRGS